MATKINKKFVLVVTGFVVAAALLLTGVIVVYQVYIQDAERSIVKGDALMAEGRIREAYNTYGRAVNKKPGELRYVEKMEEALTKIVAETNTAANEDYRQLVGVKQARTRARPADPAQWRVLLGALEEQATLFTGNQSWADIVKVAKEMKTSVPPTAPGAEYADIYLAYGRSNQTSTLSSRERAELVTELQGLAQKTSAEWRIWKGIVNIQMAEIEMAEAAGQVDEAAERTKALDETLVAAAAALGAGSAEAKAVNEQLQMLRLISTGRTGRRVDLGKIDPLKLSAAKDQVYASALASESPTMVRDAATLLATVNEPMRSLELLDAWTALHPEDLRARATAVLLRAQLAQYKPAELPALRAAAKALVEQPQQPTSLNASLQESYKATAISSLLNAELTRIADEKDAAVKAEAMAEVARLRDQLMKYAQNDENSANVLAADAKIAQVKGDIPGAQRKWDAYFAKASAPTSDMFLWAALAARARGDLSLALQFASKGMETNPDDLPLAIQRADLAGLLGRRGEELAMLAELARVLPDNEMLQAALQRAEARAEGGGPGGGAPKALLAIEEAVKAGDCAKARGLAADWAKDNPQGVAAFFVQARVELSCNNAAKAAEFVDAGLAREPNNLDLWRIKAELLSTDPIERIEILVKGVVPDPKRQAAEMLTAFRSLRADMTRREADARGPDPVGADKIKEQIARLNVRLAQVEQEAGTTASDDPAVIESNFAEAVEAYQRANQEGRQQDAANAMARAAAQLDAARKLTGNPELPIVFESTLLELQGRLPDALAMVEKARAAGQNEARLAVRLATLQEKLGNEPAAFRAWQEAYERRANDSFVVLGYSRALGRAGRGREALDMLRAAADASPMDSRLALSLAQFETTYGSRARAIQVREDLARRLQPIPENIAGLYSLLQMAPSFDAARGVDGKPLSSAQWASLSAEQRGRLLSDAAREFQARAEKLYADALAANPLDIGLAVQKARVMREQARFDEGTAAIQAVIDAAKARGSVPTGMYLDLGLHLLASNKQAAADAAFEQAKAVQDPQRRDADLVLVEIEARRGRVKEAAAALESYLQTNPRVELQVRLCELLVSADEVERATQALERAKMMVGSTPTPAMKATIEMLGAAISNSKAEIAERAGKLEEARAFRDEALAALGRAEALQPSMYVAALRRVGVLRAQAKSGGRLDTKTLELAAAESDKILARNAALYDAAAQRAGIELDKGDMQGAIGVLDRFLVAQPQDDAARSRLIALYREIGNRNKAVDLARTAADAAPYRADWREMLGDLSADNGDLAGAASAFERAYQIQPQVHMLVAKAIDARTAAGTPQAGLAFLQTTTPDTQADPIVRSAQAAALAKLGRMTEALAVAKEAIIGARAAGINSAAMQQALPRLRQVYGPEKTQELEDLLLSTGSPNAAEKVLLGSMWGDLGPAHSDKAISWADSAIAEAATIPPGLLASAHTLRGNALYLKGDLTGAVAEFFKAAELEPNSPAALNNASYISAESGGDLARSQELAERAVGLVPERSEFVDTLGYVLYLRAVKEKDSAMMQRAEEVLRRSLQLRASAAGYLHLGMVQAELGRAAEARNSFDKARQEANVSAEMLKKIEDAASKLK